MQFFFKPDPNSPPLINRGFAPDSKQYILLFLTNYGTGVVPKDGVPEQAEEDPVVVLQLGWLAQLPASRPTIGGQGSGTTNVSRVNILHLKKLHRYLSPPPKKKKIKRIYMSKNTKITQLLLFCANAHIFTFSVPTPAIFSYTDKIKM